jgi:hypothetical protein
MSVLLRYTADDKRLTALLLDSGEVIELRNGLNTFNVNTGTKWPSYEAWLNHYTLTKAHVAATKKPALGPDASLLIQFMRSKGRGVNMRKLRNGDYVYSLKTYLYVKEGPQLIPFYIAADGMMQYKHEKAKSFGALDLVGVPEFWVMDLGNHIVQYEAPAVKN